MNNSNSQLAGPVVIFQDTGTRCDGITGWQAMTNLCAWLNLIIKTADIKTQRRNASVTHFDLGCIAIALVDDVYSATAAIADAIDTFPAPLTITVGFGDIREGVWRETWPVKPSIRLNDVLPPKLIEAII